MPASQAELGYRTVLEIALASDPGVYVNIAELRSLTLPSFADSEVDVTHMQSPNGIREYIPGLTDAGQASGEMNYVPGSATDLFLRSLTRKKLNARVTFPNGRILIFRAQRQEYTPELSTDGAPTANVSLKVSGAPTLTPVAAPRNMAPPAIFGIARVGAPLELDDGAWAGASEITYQWRAGGTAIVGATENSFVPAVAQVGAVITCAVTGVNDSFSTTVISAATAAVAAA